MDQQINYGLNFVLNGAQVNAVISQVTGSISGMGNNITRTLGGMQRQLNTISLSSVLSQINGVADGLRSMSGPGMELSTSLYDLQAITGVAGEKLKEIEGYARENAKTFGGSAAEGLEAFKLVLSQLSPEIAKNPVALNAMGNSVSTLSKTMGGNVIAATEVLTTAMNQYGISTEDPIKASETMASMMNVMAAGAKEGSAELPQIKSALEQAGMAASAANVSFEETNAAIQVLDKAGKKGSEGGVALRNVLATLGEGRFMAKESAKALEAAGVSVASLGDTSKPLAQRLAMLKPIMNDAALVTKVFGKENSNAALALLGGTDEIERLTGAISGTQTAYEQAAIVMESPAEKAKRLQASVDDLKISLFNNTNGWLGYVGVLGDATRDMTNLWPAIGMVSKVLGISTIATALQAASTDIASGATTRMTVVQNAFNASLMGNPIFQAVAAIAALAAGAVYCYNHFETFRGIIWGTWEAIKGMGNIIYDLTIGVIVNLVKGIGGLGKAIFQVFTGDFSDAADTATEAVKNITGYNTAKAVYEDGVAMGQAVSEGYQEGMADFRGEASEKAIADGKAVGMAAGTSIKSNLIQALQDSNQIQTALTGALDPTGTMNMMAPVFHFAGKSMSEQIANGILAGISSIVGAASQAANAAIGAFSPAAGLISGFGMKTFANQIAPAGLPGATDPKGTGKGGVGGGGGAAKKNNEAIATGGTKSTTVNIHIDKQIENFTISTANLKEGAANLRDLIIDELTRAIAMGGSLGGATA